MIRSRILHRTYYNYSSPVMLGPHVLRLRPREGHDVRIVSSTLDLQPAANVRWYRDAEDNCIGVATFERETQQLAIVSDVTVEQYPDGFDDTDPSASASPIPAGDALEDAAILAPYLQASGPAQSMAAILAGSDRPTSASSTLQALTQLSARIHTSLRYVVRMEAGVQAPGHTLEIGAGSCRDQAALFVEAARHLGIPARFVSGYLQTEGLSADRGSTHAWAEAYVDGRGWIAFDPTSAAAVGPGHIAVSVARTPGSVPPVAGSFTGGASASLEVGVWVTRLAGSAPA